jgi:TatD DNase family protein
MLFDTHCHLMDEQFDNDLNEVIRRAHDAGVNRIVIPGIDVETSKKAIAIAEQFDGIYAAVGVHPEAAKDVPLSAFDVVRELAKHEKVVAIGEIGLDYYWDAAPRDEQQRVMATQIEIAKECGLPVIIHNREATADTVSLLQSVGSAKVRGIMHCFMDTFEIACKCIDMGFFISFGGPVTFKNARNVHEVAPKIPDESILIETDSPYLAPHPYRGKRNEPGYVRLVATRMAELKQMSVEEIADITTRNANRLFGKA